jgi:hypothetical protein
MDYVTAAIVVTLTLLAIGIVVDQLARLRKWLKNAPPGGEVPKPPEESH